MCYLLSVNQNGPTMPLKKNTLASSFLDIFLPPVCPLCGKEVRAAGSPLCGACLGELCSKLIKSPICTLCGEPFAAASTGDHVCGRCLSGKPCFSWARSVFAFDGAVREAVHRFKYAGEVTLGPALGRMFRYLEQWPPAGTHVVMPVPLHKKRLRARGFNQALVLAREVGAMGNAPVEYFNLERTRHTGRQTELTPAEREKNVSGAFALKRPEEVTGKKVLLVDDVFTTGATIRECAKVLKKAGADVCALTLARAVKV